MAVSSNVSISTDLTQSKVVDLATFSGRPTLAYTKSFSTTDITKAWHDTNSLVATTASLDLSDGSLLDPYGAGQVFTTLKYIHILNNSAFPLTVFGGTNGLIPNTIVISALGSIGLSSSFTIDGTHKIIKLDSLAATVSYSILFVGA